MIGEAIIDSYLHGKAERMCREAPVPIVDISRRQDLPGGAANAAVNTHSLGGHVDFLSVVGDDLEGELLSQALKGRGVCTEHLLTQRGRRTLAKHRLVASSQILLRFDQGHTEPIDRKTEREVIDRLADLFPSYDALLISDYGYGLLTPRVITALAALQELHSRVVVVDSKKLERFRTVGVTAAKPNYQEVVRLLGASLPGEMGARAERISVEGQRLLDITVARIAAITLDTEGALVVEQGNPPYRTYARPTTHSRAVGAGDTFVSAMALALAAGAETPAMAELASAAAAIVVAKEGTATCSGAELQEYFSIGDKRLHEGRVAARAEYYRQQGRRVVFTNGCFDILHRGHITFLNRAKALGDVLLVGLNSDESVRRLKGAGRPINTLEDRAQVLSALSCVDYIVSFEEDTPVALIEAIKPDVFVKGGTYTREMLPEAALVEKLGGAVHILPCVPELSTSNIIRRIRESSPEEEQVAESGKYEDQAASQTYTQPAGLLYDNSVAGMGDM